MTERLDPAPDEFVIRLSAFSDEAFERVRHLGSVARLNAAAPLYLLRLEHSASSKEAWQTAARELGDETGLFPVLYDRDGLPHYPTGEVTVRFEATPSDSDLRRFCEEQHLCLLRRNEFVAQQVVFEPAALASEYLPDLVSRISAQAGVHAAWANTLSCYRRSGR